jgi:hypothetical protein
MTSIQYMSVKHTRRSNQEEKHIKSMNGVKIHKYEGWNFNFGNTLLDWLQALLE